MASLIAKSPCDGLLPRTIGALSLSESVPEAITWVSPFEGQTKRVSEALKAASGVAFPAPGRTTGTAERRAIWCGPAQALVLGPSVPAIDGAACADQSDAFAVIVVEGALAEAVLARLTPLDLRASVFKRGHTARTLLNHMTVSLTRLGADKFEILVFRSMAQTTVHELTVAAERVTARA